MNANNVKPASIAAKVASKGGTPARSFVSNPRTFGAGR